MTTEEVFRPGSQPALILKAKKTPPLKLGNFEMKFEPEDLDDFYKERARNELRETPEAIKKGLEDIRKLLADEPDLKIPIDDDGFLQKFLRPCKWHAESAFGLMKRFYKFRQNYPRYCKDLSPNNEKAVLTSDLLFLLPGRSDGCRVLIIESGRRWKPKIISLDQLFRGVMLCLEAAMSEPKTQVAGVQVILDMDGLSLSHVTCFTPSYASAVLEWAQRCLCVRLKGVHVVNQPYIFNMVFAIFKPFIQEKLRKRIHFHGTDRASLLAQLDPETLPTRYGGKIDLPTEVGDGLFQYFNAYTDDFKANSECGYPPKT